MQHVSALTPYTGGAMVQRIRDSWQKWTLGLFVSITAGLVTWLYTDVKAAANEVPGLKERVAVVETTVHERQGQYQRDLDDLKQRLERVERKQDQTIQLLMRHADVPRR